MNRTADQRNQLLNALLNTEDLIRRYHHQADFHHAVNLMVGALPQHISAMAKSADEAEDLRRKATEHTVRYVSGAGGSSSG